MTSAAKAVTLSNTGSAALNITRVAVGGTNPSDFAEIADTCGSSVAAGGNCTIEVTFTPSAADSYTATLSITDNAGSSPQTVSLSGTGAHDVILSWAASGSSGVIGYNIFRGATSRKESTTPLNSSPITGTTYTDSNVTAGQTYYYMITAVSSSDVQSADSGEVSATVP
jgi:fibronectin type 3 domain-containing protein